MPNEGPHTTVHSFYLPVHTALLQERVDEELSKSVEAVPQVLLLDVKVKHRLGATTEQTPSRERAGILSSAISICI